jgi:serine/threonine-protein kinase HipA
MAMPEISILDVRLHDQSIGTLTRLPGDKVLFAFDEAYIADARRPTLSLSFKDALGGLITDIAPTQTRLAPFFSNLLPEGAMRDYLAARAGVNPVREFPLIWTLGHDLPGALKIVPFGGDSLPPSNDDLPEARDGTEEDDILRFSLAGVQLKFSAVKEASGGLTIPAKGVGGSWIVKLPSTVYPDVPENEFAMMGLARRIGIDVPEIFLTPVARISGLPQGMESGANAFVIRRFDRTDIGAAVHMEDFAQVFGLYPEKKYGKASYGNIARVLWIETGEEGIAEFLRRFVFNALIGNGDMHAKNWSLVYPDRRQAQLAPAYDFVSTIAYIPNDKLALTFVGSKAFASLSLDQFARFADKVGLPAKLTRDTVRDTVAGFREAWNAADAVPPKVRDAIELHLETVPVWEE